MVDWTLRNQPESDAQEPAETVRSERKAQAYPSRVRILRIEKSPADRRQGTGFNLLFSPMDELRNSENMCEARMVSWAGLEPYSPTDRKQVIDSTNRQKRQKRSLRRFEVHIRYTGYEFLGGDQSIADHGGDWLLSQRTMFFRTARGCGNADFQRQRAQP